MPKSLKFKPATLGRFTLPLSARELRVFQHSNGVLAVKLGKDKSAIIFMVRGRLNVYLPPRLSADQLQTLQFRVCAVKRALWYAQNDNLYFFENQVRHAGEVIGELVPMARGRYRLKWRGDLVGRQRSLGGIRVFARELFDAGK